MIFRYSQLLILLLCFVFPIRLSAEVAPASSDHYLDLSLNELLDIPLDLNTVNIQESHIHKKGEWMIGYQYMYMDMQGNLNGDSAISTQEILREYKITPTAMNMEMHMGSLMYAPTNDITLMAMLPYKTITMDHVTRKGKKFTTRSEGIGDLQLMGNFVAFRTRWNKHLVSLKAGLSIPTGSVDKRDRTPAGPAQPLPYPMQLGSGTYDLMPGISYTGMSRDWGWGLQSIGTIRTGRNDQHYRLGDKLEVSGWLTHLWADWISTSVRINGKWWDDIHGADPRLNPNLVPTANPDIRAGSQVDFLMSIELYAPDGMLKGQHLGIEIGTPLYQHLNGPQLQTDWQISAGWQWTF